MPFLKCKKCIVRSCCSEVCEDFKKYCKEKCNITIGNIVSLKQIKIALGDIEKVDTLTQDWIISISGDNSTLYVKKEGIKI